MRCEELIVVNLYPEGKMRIAETPAQCPDIMVFTT